MTIERITTRDGLKLAVEHRALANPRARLVIVHGYAEHRGRCAALVARLEAAGIECHLFDLRGHGDSEGEAAHVSRFEDYVDDLDRVTDSVRALGGTAPLFLLGHSLGGLIALTYVRAHPAMYEAIAVSSPFLGPAFPVPKVQEMLANVASVVAPRLSIESPLDPRWISHDSDVVEAYIDDPRVHRTTTPRWFTEVCEAQKELIEHVGEIHTPALFLLGGDDHIADHKIAVDLFEHLGTAASEKQMRNFPGLYHEVLNEQSADREEVIRALLSWFDFRLGARPSATS